MVLAGLAILTSLAVPNVLRSIAFGNIDEVKAALNSAAADCLQKNRFEADDKDELDPVILSDERLNTLGYKINPASNQCSYAELIPIDSNDLIRYPIGFAIAKGRVTKLATPTSADSASIFSCKNWAGENCKNSACLKELVAYNNEISKAKQACETRYNNWIKSNGNGPFNRWNPSADSQCASRCPKKVSPTCTPDGCNRKVYALDGTIVGYTEEDYKTALEAKYGRICTEKVERLRRQSPPFTNPDETPITFTECGTQTFWFYQGKEVASADEWRGKMCAAEVARNIDSVGVKQFTDYCGERKYYFCGGKDQLSQDNYDACLANNAEAKCLANREKARTSGYEGKYGPNEGPGRCGEVRWLCDGVVHESEETYKAECVPPPCIPVNIRLCELSGNKNKVHCACR